jgi:hypothetical protein
VAQMEEKKYVHMLLMGKLKGKRSLGRSRRMWKHYIKINLREIR